VPGELVHRRRYGAVLELQLDNPPVSGLSGPLLVEIVDALEEARVDDSVRAVVTTSTGRYWCVGGDLADLAEGAEIKTLSELLHESTGEGPTLGLVDRRADRLGVGRYVMAIDAFEKPLIAAIGGAVAGGGLALALLHDVRFASEQAEFTVAFTRIGLTLEMGLSHLLPRTVGPQAAYDLATTSRRVGAQEAHALGIVWRVVPEADLVDEALHYAHVLAERPPLGVQLTKRLLRQGLDRSLREQLETEWPYQVTAFDQPEARSAIEEALRRGPR